MPFRSLTFELDWNYILPPDVAELIDEASEREERFLARRATRPVCSFFPSNFRMAWQSLEIARAKGWAEGDWLCEWGSGLGVVSCLWAKLGGRARGIEFDPELVDEATGLAERFGVAGSVEFTAGNFLPPGAERLIDSLDDVTRLERDGANGYEALGRDVATFDVIYVYPWPGERRFIDDVFEAFARPGALLVSFHGGDELRARRKVERD